MIFLRVSWWQAAQSSAGGEGALSPGVPGQARVNHTGTANPHPHAVSAALQGNERLFCSEALRKASASLHHLAKPWSALGGQVVTAAFPQGVVSL